MFDSSGSENGTYYETEGVFSFDMANARTSGRPRLPRLLRPPRMPHESDCMLHMVPPPASLVPHAAAT